MARSVKLSNGAATVCGGHIVVTAHGFGVAATTLTITATGTPGHPGTMVIGEASNKNNLAKAAIPWYTGQQVLKETKVTVRVTGPEGNFAEANPPLDLSPFENFSWGPCP